MGDVLEFSRRRETLGKIVDAQGLLQQETVRRHMYVHGTY
jgi:hypothetical protein